MAALTAPALPVPDVEHVATVRAELARWEQLAKHELQHGTAEDYLIAIKEARVCRHWLDVYVDNRKDKK